MLLENQRLDSALHKENKSLTDTTNALGGKERQMESENGNSNGPKKISNPIENLPCNDSENDLNNVSKALDQNVVAGKEEDDKEDAAMQKPDHIKTQYLVLRHGDEIYDAMLNHTNVVENKNKFYVIQVLESNDGGKFMVYNRWGRVGIRGQDTIKGPYKLRDRAIREFELQFLAKTKNHWPDRKNFIYYPRFYNWLELDYSVDKESEVQEKLFPAVENQLRITKLEPQIAKFISLICNMSMMKQHTIGLGYNAEKFPLGKLSKSTILKGYDVLKRIADVIGQSDKKMLEQLSGEFYTVIPHDFGFRRLHEFIIDTHYKLKCKLEMVEMLGEIEDSTSLFEHDIYTKEDPLYSHYQCLRCVLTLVKVDSEEFSMIERYMRNTDTNTHYSTEIVHIFRTSREGENERFRKFSRTKNRMLLWHGSRLKNWTGILSQGLRIAPPDAPLSGSFFGKGVYFADMSCHSADYCRENCASMDGVLLLCEVALGDMNELLSYDENADKLPKGKLSTKGVGKIAPDLSEAQILEDGVIVPLGKPKEQPEGILLHNEYIVYNVDQIRIRYIVHINFSYILTGDRSDTGPKNFARRGNEKLGMETSRN